MYTEYQSEFGIASPGIQEITILKINASTTLMDK